MISDLTTTAWPVLIVLSMIAAGILLVRLFVPSRRLPYERRKRLVTQAELRFYRVLQRAVGDSYSIFAMVRIADLLVVTKGSKNYRSWLNKILAKHVDFVLCDDRTMVPVLAIELDDASHQRPDRIKRDIFVNQAFEAAGLPLLRITVSKEYHPGDLRDEIDALVE